MLQDWCTGVNIIKELGSFYMSALLPSECGYCPQGHKVASWPDYHLLIPGSKKEEEEKAKSFP